MPPTSFSEKRNLRPMRPLIAAPASGNRGTSQISLYIGSFSRLQVRPQNIRPGFSDPFVFMLAIFGSAFRQGRFFTFRQVRVLLRVRAIDQADDVVETLLVERMNVGELVLVQVVII